MNIVEAKTAQTRRGPVEWFTGTVWLQELKAAPAKSQLKLLRVTFEPGAHGVAYASTWANPAYFVRRGTRAIGSAPVVEVHPGDNVWIAPGERHWHGAAPNCAMAHLPGQLAGEDGISTRWLEHVSEADHG